MTVALLIIKGFLITFIAIMFLRPLSAKLGLVDTPGGRKKHLNTVPLIGGIAIFFGISFALMSEWISAKPYYIFWLGAWMLMGVAVFDDICSIRASYRFVVQFMIIVLMAYFSGTLIDKLGNIFGTGLVDLGWGSLVFTGFAVVGIINAVNMLDGMDGLTASVSLAELGILLFLAMHYHYGMESKIVVTVIGALCAFLLFNFPTKGLEKRKIFLGDAGSMLLGLLIAWVAMRLTQPGPSSYPPALMLWIVALPLMDTLHLMMDRKVHGSPLFRADRRHIHHVLLHFNYSPKQITLMLTGFSILIAITGVVLFQQGMPESYLFWGMVFIFFGYSWGVYCLKKHMPCSNASNTLAYPPISKI